MTEKWKDRKIFEAVIDLYILILRLSVPFFVFCLFFSDENDYF